jgi:TrmH family RNA methyltransferase
MISKEKQKYIRNLHSKKWRQSESKFLVEWGKSVEELLQSDFNILHLYITRKFFEKYAELLQWKEYIICETEDIEKSSTLHTNDMALAIVEQKYGDITEIDYENFSLVLDTMNDPWNFGTILRIADWYWIKQVICSRETVEMYNPKVIIASMGSFTRMKVFYTDLTEFLENTTLPVYWSYLDWENVHIKEFTPNGHIIIWNESHWISEQIEKYITNKITIPKFGWAESLNAWVATAVILDNVMRNITK